MSKGGVFVSGSVLDVDYKSGVSAKTGEKWGFHIVSVLTGKTVTELRWDAERLQGAMVKEGDVVNVRAEFDVYGGRLQCNAVAVEPVLSAAKTA